MTDIIVLHNFAGRKRGQIIPLEPWMLGHVRAGNAKVLPDAGSHEGGASAQEDASILMGASTGSFDDAPSDDEDMVVAIAFDEEE